jgi:putative addiction module component (TIGR02574 family)
VTSEERGTPPLYSLLFTGHSSLLTPHSSLPTQLTVKRYNCINKTMNTMQDIRKEVLSLSASERACLVHDLILSLDAPADFDLSAGQESEIQRRCQKVREGKAFGRPSDDVFSDIKVKY